MTKIPRTLTLAVVFSAAALPFSSCTPPEPEIVEYRSHMPSRPAGEEPLAFLNNEKAEQETKETRSPNHRTIYEASRKGDIEDVKLHLRQGAEVNTVDERNNFTPLHWAVNVRNAGMTELLLEHGADVNARSKNLSTPLHWAVILQKDIEIAKLMLDHGADIHARDEIGLTPSGAAAKLDHPELASPLNQYDKTK